MVFKISRETIGRYPGATGHVGEPGPRSRERTPPKKYLTVFSVYKKYLTEILFPPKRFNRSF